MRILMMGGTRFIGVYLTRMLVEQGHEVALFNRGNRPTPVEGVRQIIGDRTSPDQLQKLATEDFDAIFDNNGRELSDTQPLAEIFQDRVQHFVYMSSAGVYLKSDQMPHVEGDPVDPKSRHRGKHETETFLSQLVGLPFTSIRPTYIYGAGNYNELESWFFDRIVRDRPVPIPGNGLHITQLGHVKDLAKAMVNVLGNQRAIGQIYNVSGDRYITFAGLARACAEAAGLSGDKLQIIHYDPKQFDFGKRKAFPMRVQHFFADVHKAMDELNWQPKFDLISGLKDSFQNDYLAAAKDKANVDFSCDDEILK